MCFSAPASFTSAAVLTVAAVASFRLVRHRSELPIAMIPLFFAIQQFCEGWIWIFLERGINTGPYLQAATWGFLFFAFLLWPFWTPFAMLMVEKVPWRKAVLGVLFAIGTFVSFQHLMYAIQYSPGVKIVGHSIQYEGEVPDFRMWYGIAVTVPCLFSSWRWMWLFGLLVGVAFVIADLFFVYAFVSVWCFFAALVSA